MYLRTSGQRVHVADVVSLGCRELEVAAYGVDECEPAQAMTGGGDPLIADLHSEFTASMRLFQQVSQLQPLHTEG